MSVKSVYKIAGIYLKIEGVDVQKKWKNLTSFVVSENLKKNIQVTVKCLKEFDEIKGDSCLVYKDETTWVYENHSEIYCFRGRFSDIEKKTVFWSSCMKYKKDKKNQYEIFLKKQSVSEKMVFNAMCFEKIMVDWKRVILHSSFILYKKQGIVFTAPSGTGKSTQAKLWADEYKEVEIVNGDKSILSCDMENPMVHGLPFCGTSDISLNKSAPLRAVVVLRQGVKNQVECLEKRKAVSLLLSECMVSPWDKAAMGKILEILIHIVDKIPVYYFSCLPNRDAVVTLKKVLEKDGLEF